MTDRSSVALRTIGSRATLLGAAPNSLEGVNTIELDDGCRCYVTAAHAEFQLHRDSVLPPDGTTIIEPVAGPGRWIIAAGSSFSIPFPVADIDATGIPDGDVVQASGGIAIWGPVPVAFAIESFALTGSTLVQVGATVATPHFAASYNAAATSVTLNDTDGHSNLISLPGTSFVSPFSFTKNVEGASVTFTDLAVGALGSDSSSATLSWGELVYYGPAVDTGVYNAAFITGLPSSNLQLGAAGTFGITAGVGQSSFFAALTSYGLTISNFFVGGFPFACSKVASAVSVTNIHGIVETYDVFRSDNTGLGPFSLTVT